jgi:copper/silver efflux system protein
MLERIIEWSVHNKFIVGIFAVFAVVGGVLAMRTIPLEAIPDLSDVQVIVRTDHPGQAPQIIEDQITYPIASEMLKVPGAQTVRGYSFFGTSFVYIIFDDATDLYWARSRVLEYMSGIRGQLPAGAEPELGPDATGLGWVYQYVIEDHSGTRSLADLRAFQDWYLRYQLTAVPGVSEVASIGGFEQTYQITVDPAKLRGFGIPITRVSAAIRASNQDVGAMMMEMAEREFMIRGLGYLTNIEDIDNVVVGATDGGTPIRVADVARVELAPDVRRGIGELDGRGEVVGGIVVMRYGENALATIDRVKAKLAEIGPGLPDGIEIKPVYDRSGLIMDAIGTLQRKLIEEGLIVALIVLLFLFHARSALVALLTLPLGILIAFMAMRALGLGADIMSLGGIAIAIGAMIDAGIVMIENMHKHLERAVGRKRSEARERGEELPGGERMHTNMLTTRERWDLVAASAKEVGPALFFSLLIITVSFMPVFALEAQEGRMFKPLAWTKTLAMASASLLAITVIPVAMGLLVRGRIHAEKTNPISRALRRVYRPALAWVLDRRVLVIAMTVAVVLLTFIPFSRIGSEFMPPLDEGTLLYMPTTLPGISIATVRQTLIKQDSILKSFPEVVSVFGKAGRANTATDPAPLAMFETTIVLKPRSEWRPGLTTQKLIAEMDRAMDFPGITNAWTMPIRGRIDMLATGIRTPVGVKVFGPDLHEISRIAKEVEEAAAMVPGTRSAFAERAVSGYYLDVDIDRVAAARYGLNVQDIQMVLASAVGGMQVTQMVEGRERYGVRIRYPQELRDQPEKLAELLIPVTGRRAAGGGGGDVSLAMAGMGGTSGGGMTMGGGGAVTQVPLGEVATIRSTSGPMMIKTEGAFPTAWVYLDVVDRDIGGYVADARAMVDEMVELPAGYTLEWSGQYEFMERAKKKLQYVVPATLLLIFLLLYMNFRTIGETLIVMLALPFALVGGVLFMWLAGYNWSVASVIGFIALAGVAAETGVVMLVFLGIAWRDQLARGPVTSRDLYRAVMDGAVERLRPIMMTTLTVIFGLLPILWSAGTGASVMKRIAAPMVGGMISATLLTLLVIPAMYSLWREWGIRRDAGREPEPVRVPVEPVRPEPVAVGGE